MNQLRLALFLVIPVSLLLASCSSDDKEPGPAKTPEAISGPGAGLIEVPRDQLPNSPYWLGPPRKGAYLFIEDSLPGNGRLVYAQPNEAQEIDAGREPIGAMQVQVIKVPAGEIAQQQQQARRARKYGKFIRRSPIGTAYLATSGRQVRIPIDNYKMVVVIKARDSYLINNALGLVRPTGKK